MSYLSDQGRQLKLFALKEKQYVENRRQVVQTTPRRRGNLEE